MGGFDDATRQRDRRLLARELALRCVHCPAMNRPGATLVMLETETRAFCMVCGKVFNPTEEEKSS